MEIAGCYYNPTNRDDESDDDYLPPLEKVFQTRFLTKASVKPSKPKRNQ
jgi:hypothetical protein